MKKVVVLFFVLVIAAVTILIVTRPKREETRLKREKPMKERPQFNLGKPEKQVVKIDEKEYPVLLTKYDPPHSHAKLLASKEGADCSTPEGADLALWSAVGRDKDWYLSLFDEGAREHLLRRDQKTGGKILGEYNKDKPLLDPIKTGNYSKFMYKVELESQGKKYAIIHQRDVFEGTEEPSPSFRTFIKQGDAWLVTDDLKEHPVEMLVGLKSYEEIREILKEGSWSLE